MTEDDWLTAAMADHNLVARLLLKLKKSPQRRLNHAYPPVLRLDWTVKQRRSKPVVSRKKPDATRASPATPLSWSGGTSGSCCAATGVEESKPIDTARSKVVVAGDTPIAKRSRKKKTLPELKEEESLLLKERRNLKNQLSTIRLTLDKEKETNERLKRLKVDLLSRPTPERNSSAVKSEETDSLKPIKMACDPTSPVVKINPVCGKMEPPAYSSLCKKEAGGLSSFELPDLNLPVDENSESNVLCGVS